MLFHIIGLMALLCLDPVSGRFSLPKSTRPVRTRTEGGDTSNPCGEIIDQVNEGYYYFQAELAYACLTSVPFNAAVAHRFVDYVNTTIQFQSTLAYLKDPPKGYQQPPVDILGGLQTIKDNITEGFYKSQYSFEISLQELIHSAHDAHLSLEAGILRTFTFQSQFEISSVSPDGVAPPKVYLTDSLRYEEADPLAVTALNDRDPIEFLKELAARNAFGSVEAHADWNQLFTTPTLDILGQYSLFYGHLSFYPGPDLNVTLEDNSTYQTEWVAQYEYPYNTGPLTTGGDFYNFFVLDLEPASFDANTTFNPAYEPNRDGQETYNTTQTLTVNGTWSKTSLGAYPDPDLSQLGLKLGEDGIVSAYFLEDVDTAVLSIPSFDQVGMAVGNFSQTVADFLSKSSRRNLTRAVIDLQGNTGGTVELVFSTFKRFFPHEDPFAGSRRRNSPLANVLGESFTARFDNRTKDGANDLGTVANEWVITSRLNAATGQNFSSWTEYLDGTSERGDAFSVTEQYNLTSWVFDRALFDTWMPWGYTYRFPPEGLEKYKSTFDAENIVLLTDGACSSACALLIELFTLVGAHTVAMGGQPISGPMQSIGGNRGASSYSALALDHDIQSISQDNATAKALLPALNDNGVRDSGVYTESFSVNLRDQVRPNDTLPLQFRYLPADCRLYYTLKNAYNMSRLWRDVAAAAFDDPAGLCIKGSTGFRNTSKAAPTPEVVLPAALPVEVVPDSGFAYTFNEDDGLQDFLKAKVWGQIVPCDKNDNGCGSGTQCVTVSDVPCANTDGQKMTKKLCLWETHKKNKCGSNTVFKQAHKVPSKGVYETDQVEKALSQSRLSAGWTGFCWPTVTDPAWAGKNPTCYL